MKNADRRIALITGGNRGLGLQTARELVRQDIHVVLGCRDYSKGNAVAQSFRVQGYQAETIAFDIADQRTHQGVYDYLAKAYGRLDILINNAAVRKESASSSSPLPESNRTSVLSSQILRETLETNFFGTVALTQKLLPLIRKSFSGRIVNVSSVMGSLTLHSDPKSPIYPYKFFAYDTSKAALNSFTIHLAHELRGTSIKINSAHPGWVRTEMGGEGADLDIAGGGKTSAWLATLGEDGPTGGYFHLGKPLPW
jgi:NAD(P)-dependent dehydrogenase (short-subunit alcohol dehydrogenase family)